jgi:signal transduction histidine kinase
MMTRRGRFFLALILALAPLARAQRYSDFRMYRAVDGMAESACVSVSISANGKVVAKHLNEDSMSLLDGFTVAQFPSPEAGRNRIYASTSGQLWTINSEGLLEFRDGSWRLHPVPEIASRFHGMITAVLPMVSLHIIKQGRVLVLLPDVLLEFNVENPDQPHTTILRTAGQTALQKFFGMSPAHDGGLWISGPRGLAHAAGPIRNLKPDSAWQEYAAPGALPASGLQQPCTDLDDDGVTCVADAPAGEQRVLVHFDGQNWTTQPIGTEKVRGAWRGFEGVTWLATINGLYQIDNSGSPSAEIEEITTGRFFDVDVETNGIFWLASAEGLMRYSPPLWKSPRATQRQNWPVLCVAEDSESRLWFVSAGALHSLEDGQHKDIPFYRAYQRALQGMRTLLPLRNGDLLLDAGSRQFQFQPANGLLNPLAFSGDGGCRALGVFRDGSIAMQRTNAQGCQLEKYDGTALQPVSVIPPDCSFSSFFETQNGDLWFGSEHGPAWYHDKKWQMLTNNFVPAPVVGFVETPDGKLWCATPDSIWEFSGQNWSAVRGGFDQINNIIRSHDGNIWVSSNGGLYRFIQGTWVENSLEEGLPNAAARQIYEDHQGGMWAATSRGLTRFHPEADPDPPRTIIRRQPGNETVAQNAIVNLTFLAEDKWKYTPQDRLLYSYRLDQHDWSQFLEANTISYSDLAAGPHSFEVRAMDRNGNVEMKPAHMAFIISLPWYRETRLVLISCAGMLAALFFAALAFNRHRKLLRSYAEVERKVAERTRELEITSRELVQSQKMNALGTLAAGIAHDFNNILSIIKGSAQIIEDNVDNSEKVRTRVDRIKTVVEQGAGIVKAMLGFSAGSSEDVVLCDINSVVNDTIQLLGDRFQRDSAVLFQPGAALPGVPVVKEFVQQILLNFIFNAAEAEVAARRKQIIVSTRWTQRLPANLALAPANAREYMLVSVQDFGSGIQPENLPRIFEPFFTTKAMSARRGTGLGLSMVYELAKKLEAGIWVESTVDVGSTFTLILPLRDLKANEPSK